MERKLNIDSNKINSESGVDWQTATGNVPIVEISSSETEHEVKGQKSETHSVVETAIEVIRHKSLKNFIELMGI